MGVIELSAESDMLERRTAAVAYEVGYIIWN